MTKNPDRAQVQETMDALLDLPELQRSDRLSSFLVYVVEEAMAGRADGIKAKTIAQDVYDRDTTGIEDNSNIVRVDARRLRRILDDHYANGGADAAVKILLRSGSYVPVFETEIPKAEASSPLTPARPYQARSGLNWIAAAGLLVACIFVTMVWLVVTPAAGEREDVSAVAERLALFDHSGAVLQAENLCTQGKGLLFPIAEPQQQAAASMLFQRAAELAPDYACGFSGAGHSLATQALLTTDPVAAADLLDRAGKMADRARTLAPRDGWAVSAVAWVTYGLGEHSEAAKLSKMSEQLSPRDGNVLDFHGVISALTGDYKEALLATDPARDRDTYGLSHAHRNVYGVASFHAEDYDGAIEAFNQAIRLGEPVSALTLTYLTAAHQALGETSVATEYARELRRAWPQFRADAALSRFYADKVVAQHVISLLNEAGWTSRT